MSTSKHIDLICVIIVVLCLILTILFMNGTALGIEVIRDADAEGYTGSEWFSANDLSSGWDDGSATVIALQGDSAVIRGGGAYAYDGGVVIANSGRYVISGSLSDGSITVDADDSAKVWLRLDGVDVNCADDACLRIQQADKVFLTLSEGTENSFTSGAAYSESALDDGAGGVIYAHDDLTINGDGSLTVTAQYKHGIEANDELIITGGHITVTAPGDGVHVNDSFRFTGAYLTVEAGDDAIHCDREICIESGSIRILNCYEGLEALTVEITGGDISIRCTDDGINANGGSSFGAFGLQGQNERSESDSSSGDGAESWVRISGGSLTIVNTEGRDADGIDSNGSVYIDGGTIRISLSGDGGNNAIDYGSESGGVCIVTGGSVIACGGSMMMEGFSDASSQCAVLYNLESTAAAGTAFRVLDAAGNELLHYAPECSYSSVAFSCDALSVGETYTVCIGEETAELTLESYATEYGGSGGFGGFPGGFGGSQSGGFPGRSLSGADGERAAAPEGGFRESGGERPSPPDRQRSETV